MDLSGTHIGKVVYIDDPTHSGRCKVRVFGMLDEIDDEHLPWFTPTNSAIFGTEGAGSIDVPKVGAIVRVKFENGNIYSGTYSACEMKDPLMLEEIKDDYEDAHVLLYDSDQDLMVIYQKMSGIKIYHNNSFVLIDPTGAIHLNQDNKSVVELVDGDIYVTTKPSTGGSNSTGTINITSGNTVNVIADSTVVVNADKIVLGKSGGKHLVCAESLANVLHEFAIAIDAKMPQSAGALSAREYNDIRATKIECDG